MNGPEGPIKVVVTGRFSAGTAHAQMKAAVAGLGICMLPTLITFRALRDGSLVEVAPGYRQRARLTQPGAGPGAPADQAAIWPRGQRAWSACTVPSEGDTVVIQTTVADAMPDPKISSPGLDGMPAMQVGVRLSEQLANALVVSIRDGQLKPGQRLPTEAALVERFGVSRTVVREALSRLKTLGLLESRQGSGAFIRHPDQHNAEHLVLRPDGSVAAVLQMVEVRRALETEAAALAAARTTASSAKQIRHAMHAIDKAVAAGGDGVSEDVAFHAAIARATGNPFLLATLAYLNQFLLDATRVTRANEATREDLVDQVRHEHAALVAAIERGDVAAARMAGAAHMVNAAERIGRAAPAFWKSQGLTLADRLRAELGAPHSPAPPTAARRQRVP